MNVPRFLVFAGDNYYPGGGWQDYIGSFEDYFDAALKAQGAGKDWWQIVDLTSNEIVDEGHKS